MLNWLTRRADPELLAEIEDAPLSRDYYGDMVLALQNTFLYDDIAFCLLPCAEGPEIVGEVADLLIRCREIQRVFCGAMVDEDVIVSVRTAEGGGNATELIRDAGRSGTRWRSSASGWRQDCGHLLGRTRTV